MMPEENKHVLLSKFKRRMKIFHTSEDEYLNDILEPSELDILSLVGEDAKDDKRTIELIIERSRYVYNDSLEFFYDNFQQRIMDISLDYATHLDGDTDGDTS